MAAEHAKRLGLGLQCPDLPRHSPTLTAIEATQTVTADSIRDRLRDQGILVAVGLGPFEGRSVRIGHMGDIRPADVERTLAALSGALDTR